MANRNLCFPSGLPQWYALDSKQPHRKKSNGFNAGERAGQATDPFVSNPPSLKMFVQKLRYLSTDMWRCPAMLFSYRQRRILWITRSSTFHKISVIRSCHTSLDHTRSSQVIAWCSTQYVNRKSLFNMSRCHLVWILLSPGVWSPCVANMVPHPWTRMSRRDCSGGCSHSQCQERLAWPSSKRCCTVWRWQDGNHHGAQLSIPVSMLHQSSCKFCAGLPYTAFTSSTSPRHC